MISRSCVASRIPVSRNVVRAQALLQLDMPTLGGINTVGPNEYVTAIDILEELVRIRPDFRAFWDGANLFRDDDGSFTPCGVFSHFTQFFCEHHTEMKQGQLHALAALVECCERDESVADAAYTCFLENIAGDPPDETLAPFLSSRALEFMSQWRATE